MTHEFLWGALAMASAVAALFFLRFWRTTHDRLFVFFGLAFAALAAHWVGLGAADSPNEARPGLFAIRLAAFALILVGIIDKNRRARTP